jgi:hypothetical protein
MEFKGHEASTHIPVLRAVIRDYNPLFVLELGIGIYSTPVLVKSNYVGIENNSEWIGRIKTLFPDADIRHHETDIKRGTFPKELNREQIGEITIYYRSLVIPDIHPNFLFVDNYAAFRTIAINELRDKFDIIAYHDCQPEVTGYEYDKVNKEGFNSYYLKSPTSWTCSMVRIGIDSGKLDLPLREYLNDWPDCKFLKYE